MDSDNLANLRRQAGNHTQKLFLMLDFAPDIKRTDVPDPYYGENGFDEVFDMIEISSSGLIEHIKQQTRQQAGRHIDV